MNEPATIKPAEQILWPQWVINEMGSKLYKSSHPAARPTDWARINDNERQLYTGYAHAALQCIVDFGWVRLPKDGE